MPIRHIRRVVTPALPPLKVFPQNAEIPEPAPITPPPTGVGISAYPKIEAFIQRSYFGARMTRDRFNELYVGPALKHHFAYRGALFALWPSMAPVEWDGSHPTGTDVVLDQILVTLHLRGKHPSLAPKARLYPGIVWQEALSSLITRGNHGKQ